MRFLAFLFLTLLLLPAVAFAGQLTDGAEALYISKDYPSALHLLQPLADQGSPDAQIYIAKMHEHGLGVKQNYSEALFWGLLAASYDTESGYYKEAEKHLTSKEITEVRKRAEEWQPTLEPPPAPVSAKIIERMNSEYPSPTDSAAALAAPDKAILYSLLPNSCHGYPSCDVDNLEGYIVLGKIVLNHEQALQAATEFKNVINAGREALCFNPRHGLRIYYKEHLYDFILCYECGGIVFYVDGKMVKALGAGGSPRILNDILIKANIPLRRLAE